MLRLVERLDETRPDLAVLVTTGTVASACMLASRLPARAHHQFVPVDLPGWVGRFLDHWRPDLALWVESELWPNLVLMTAARGVPIGAGKRPTVGALVPALAGVARTDPPDARELRTMSGAGR